MTESGPSNSTRIHTSGQLETCEAVELLLQAAKLSFQGSLVAESQPGRRWAMHFVDGFACAFQSPESPAIQRRLLTESLPYEQLVLVAQHAREHGLDELSAARQLVLLPSAAISRLHGQCFTEEWLNLLAEGGTVRYRFFPEHDFFAQAAIVRGRIDPFPTVIEVIAKSPQQTRFWERLSAARHDLLLLRPSAKEAQWQSPPALRQIVSALTKRPESLETLRSKRVVPEEWLVATVYALGAAGHLEEALTKQLGRSVSPGGASAGPSASPSSAGRYSLGPTGSEMNSSRPGPSSNTSTSGTYRIAVERSAPPASSGSLRPQDEGAVESATLDAWTRAVADPSCQEKALRIAERAALHFPKNARILFYLGCLLSLNQRLGDAEAALLRVLELDPEHSEAQRELMVIQRSLKGRSQTRTRDAEPGRTQKSGS